MNYVMFGKRIRNHRKIKQMTQGEVADAAGISLSFLGHIERGTRKASIETLKQISSALGIATDELLRDSFSNQRAIPCPLQKPADHFATIRKALDLLEAERELV